jgi:hypothetical protein
MGAAARPSELKVMMVGWESGADRELKFQEKWNQRQLQGVVLRPLPPPRGAGAPSSHDQPWVHKTPFAISMFPGSRERGPGCGLVPENAMA